MNRKVIILGTFSVVLLSLFSFSSAGLSYTDIQNAQTNFTAYYGKTLPYSAYLVSTAIATLQIEKDLYNYTIVLQPGENMTDFCLDVDLKSGYDVEWPTTYGGARIFYRTGGALCPQDTITCEDGSTLHRSGTNCGFPTCPTLPKYHITKIASMLVIGGLILTVVGFIITGYVLWNKYKGRYAPQVDEEATTKRFPVVELQDGWEDKGLSDK